MVYSFVLCNMFLYCFIIVSVLFLVRPIQLFGFDKVFEARFNRKFIARKKFKLSTIWGRRACMTTIVTILLMQFYTPTSAFYDSYSVTHLYNNAAMP